MPEFPRVRPAEHLAAITEAYKSKVGSSVIPPDPLRLLEFALRTAPTIEHILPLPPILEHIHSEVVSPLIESLPRLPLTSEPPVMKWKEWVKEE